MASKKSSNTLNISLTESTVFLRGVDFTGRRRNHDNEMPAMIRGLLTLELSKPTRISSIEVELQGKTSSALPDAGVGPRRTEIIEEHKVYCASQVFFRATAPSTTDIQRRALSVDPGLHLYRDDDRAPDYTDATTPTEPQPSRGRARLRRQQSADFSIHQSEFERHERPPLHHHDSSESGFERTPDLTPPASPRGGERYVVQSLGSAGGGTYEYEARSLSRPASRTPSRTPSRAPSPSRSRVRPMMSISGSPSFNHHPSDGQPSTSTSARVSFDEDSNPMPTIESRSRSRSQIPDNHNHSVPPPTPPHPGLSTPPHDRDGTESPRDRGRHSARFSLANTILDAVKERVRSNSPIVERGRSHQKSRDVSKGKERETPLEGLFPHLHLPSAIGKGKPLVAADEEEEDRKEFGNGWREFKKGTYTFPISFSVPPNMPPTLACFYGTVGWRLKATVHRPGVLTQKMSASKDVTLVAAPSEDDTEDTENIVVERFWDTQMQYMFTISGRMFTIGNTVPIDMTFLPMSKMKIHRLSVYLEEKVDYYVHQHRMSRSDAPARIVLLSLKHEKDEPILPLSTSDPHSLIPSPLHPLLPTDPYEASEAAANLMGPGPWKLNVEAKIPKNAHPTNRNRKANMVVGHTLKIVMRVERGDNQAIDPRTGKQKLFEIVVQTPVYILSHLADAKFTALPRYSESFDRGNAPGPSTRRTLPLPTPIAIAPPVAEGVTPPATQDPAVYDRYERLITGQESEMGEAPPAYSVTPPRTHSV
ncbi:hypothetical protein PENSPDRAFT_654907 [Peniophora sp. CONT]|nr:hypothetical protein PENSPDRAFT_654907 [Peniophora sp. CONT]